MPKDNVFFTVNPSLEFIHALNFVANKEARYKFYSDFNIIPTEEFKQIVEEMKGKLSRYIQNELKFFFQWEPMMHTLGRIVEEHKHIENVSTFIEFIEQMHENEILSYITSQALYGVNANTSTNWSMDENMANNISNIIFNMDDDTTIDKERLIEFAESPLEIKSRLVLLMKQFYEKSYKQNEAYILSKLDEAKKRYEKLYSDNLAYFADEYLHNTLPRDNYKKLIIHISYFTLVRVWFFTVNPYDDTQWIHLGIYSEYYPRKKFIKAKVQNFIRILSDKKRFEIIERLSKKPYYVYELAAELDLTSPTVCYHLNHMLDLNLVSLEKENNKTYYSLNKEMVKELLNNASSILLND
ncbi:DNA-binding transcriptional ArsR family regulator [Anaerosolibacter carboniphilus]|uniref:DNA-binding transcriptional ArsR family regulator n=1 Tax=Anaerosolibacter carboniphilus TaxID=1417629 RepID=A0A841L2Z9_9FIRM|nr:metalloregulator ArsR/SmtB family transcription factor [Anaerosolibacter carboniphilus]MBB6217522.1 DNA-binding transcriptional ArsR family regulator [Anaerosolibacter carboniphilus]